MRRSSWACLPAGRPVEGRSAQSGNVVRQAHHERVG